MIRKLSPSKPKRQNALDEIQELYVESLKKSQRRLKIATWVLWGICGINIINYIIKLIIAFNK